MSPSIDLMPTGEVQRFRAEAQNMARLKPPNIARVLDVHDFKSRPFLSMGLSPAGNPQSIGCAASKMIWSPVSSEVFYRVRDSAGAGQ